MSWAGFYKGRCQEPGAQRGTESYESHTNLKDRKRMCHPPRCHNGKQKPKRETECATRQVSDVLSTEKSPWYRAMSEDHPE
jgi:hypothetical protein